MKVGKVERTLFDWLENPSLRQRCQAGLNKSEQRHQLTQALYTFRQGRVADRSREAQPYKASGLNLVIASIVWWKSTYMADTVAHLRNAGEHVPDELLAHTSPVGWEHIAFSGDFLWNVLPHFHSAAGRSTSGEPTKKLHDGGASNGRSEQRRRVDGGRYALGPARSTSPRSRVQISE